MNIEKSIKKWQYRHVTILSEYTNSKASEEVLQMYRSQMMNITNYIKELKEIKNKINHVLPYKSVKVVQTPVSERIARVGDDAQLDIVTHQIRFGGIWFTFNENWIIEEIIL
jgi:plasmid replication initiation protein